MGRGYHILWAGRHARPGWEALCQDYRTRIERSLPVVDRLIKVKVGGDGAARRRAEAEALLAACPQSSWLVALDVRGKAMSSSALARRLAQQRESSPHPIVFAIGSDLGLDPSVVAAASLRLSLGAMTLGHELARLVLYEQLYRAAAIQQGINYHRDRF